MSNKLIHNIALNWKKYKDIYLLNYLLIIVYVIAFIVLEVEVTERLMFSTVDSVTYWLSGNEFYKFNVAGYSEIRPFLYPLIIVVVHNIFGTYGLWIMQMLFWFLAINLIFVSLKKITASRIVSFTGCFIIALNMSYYVLTFIALTEVTINFLIAILIYFTASNINRLNSLRFYHGCLFLFVTLAVIKPIFYLPTLLMLFFILPIFYFKKYKGNLLGVFKLLLIITPLLFQLTLMKVKYGSFTFSKIGPNTLSWGMLSQGVQQNNNISLDAARAIAQNFSYSQRVSYLLDNKLLYTQIYFQNLRENIKALPCFILYPNNFTQPVIVNYMIIVNTVYYYLHLIFIFPLLFCIYMAYKRKKRYGNGHLILFITTAALIYYIFLTSPVSFGEGDRLVLTALPAWVFLYSIVFASILNLIRKEFK